MQEATAAPRTGPQHLEAPVAAPALPFVRRGIAALAARPFLVVLAAALGLGVAVRLTHLLSVDFPLNDGGLFYVMVRDLQANHYLVPGTSSYNADAIPFAYPYVPFYLAALLDDLTPLSLLDVMRFLPLVANLLTIGAVYLLARELLGSRLVAAIAVLFFVLLPRSHEWMIMGGGLTRSFGYLFALLALHQLLLLYRRRERRFLVSSAVLAALTVLSHPEAAWVLAFSAALLLLCYGRDRAALVNSAYACGAVVVLTAPWWLTVLAQNGMEPFLSAAQTGQHKWDAHLAFYSWRFTEQPFLNLPAALALLGGVVALARRNVFLPLWLFAMVVLEPRSAATYATAPLAMLMALAIDGLVLPIWNGGVPAPTDQRADAAVEVENKPALAERWPWLQPQVFFPKLAIVLFFAYVATISLEAAFYPLPALGALSQDERDAMAWVAENTDDDASFLVISGTTNPWTDRTSEWFPALSGRTSLGTAQGYEWMGKGAYDQRLTRAVDLQLCGARQASCLERWLASGDVEATHIFLLQSCCSTLERSLITGVPAYRLLHQDRGALIFERLGKDANASLPQLKSRPAATAASATKTPPAES